MSKVNIVIRTLNEAKWLDLCLRSIENQNFQDFTITVVDSGSDDLTIKICENRNVRVMALTPFLPGKAINRGIESEGGATYGVILSAHCVPTNKDWLGSFVSFMDNNLACAAAFGLQSPMNFTNADNARDLALAFTGNTRVTADTFFHNANSIVRLSVWEKYRFNETVKHIEDLLWSSEVVHGGLSIGYCKEAEVTHYHGLHQHEGERSFRARGLNDILEENNLVKSWSLSDIAGQHDELVVNAFGDESLSKYFADSRSFCWKNIEGYSENSGVQQVIELSLKESFRKHPQALAVQFFSEIPASMETTDQLLQAFFNHYPDIVVPVIEDFGNYWIETDNKLRPIQSNYELRENKSSILKENILSGGIISIAALRGGQLLFSNKHLEKI
jgi:hypothetical protein